MKLLGGILLWLVFSLAGLYAIPRLLVVGLILYKF